MVEDASTLGVRGVVQLEAAIKTEAIDDIGAHAPAHAVRCFEHRDLDTVSCEMTSCSEPAQPCSYDDDSHGAHVSRLRPVGLEPAHSDYRMYSWSDDTPPVGDLVEFAAVFVDRDDVHFADKDPWPDVHPDEGIVAKPHP